MEMTSREKVIVKLEPMSTWNNFAQSLLQQYHAKGDLSERQWIAAKRMILKTEDTQERTASLARDVDVSRIKDLLVSANVKRPVFRAAGLSLSLAPMNGRNAGGVYVKRGDEFQGTIIDGRFRPSKACQTSTVDAVLLIARNPKREAVKHGKITGRCSCCGRLLTDPLSIDMGIGPVCVKNWGL